MPRVVHLITQLALGGAQRLAMELVRRMPEGWEGHLWAGPGGELEAEASSDPRLRFRRIGTLEREFDLLRDTRALRELAKAFVEMRPEIVHTHSSKAGILGRKAASLAGVPHVVHTVHGWSFHPGLPAATEGLYTALEHAAAAHTDVMHCVCESDVRKGLAAGIGEPQQYRVAHGGIDAAPYLDLQPTLHAPTVVTLSCLKPQKDLETWLAVAARVRQAVPNARFVIAGDGELRAELEARRRALGLDSVVEMRGWEREVPKLLASADLFLLTSRWEGFPLAVLEAMAAGLPVVATAVDGTPEAVEDGVTGFLAAPGDTEALSRHVIRLLEEPSLRRKLGLRGQELVTARFTLERFCEGVYGMYSHLIHEAPDA